MRFYSFNSQEERRKLGGSCFIEMQLCRAAAETEIREIVLASIKHWQNDSLYVLGDDMNTFYEEYSNIFNCEIRKF